MALEHIDLPANREGSCVDRLKRITSSSRTMDKDIGGLFDWSHTAWGLSHGLEMKSKIEAVERKLITAEGELPGLNRNHTEFSRSSSEASERSQSASAELQRLPTPPNPVRNGVACAVDERVDCARGCVAAVLKQATLL